MAGENASGASVRPATSADAERMGGYGIQLTKLHHQWDPDRFIWWDGATAEGYGAVLLRQIGKPQSVVLVVEEEGTVYGYCWGSMSDNDYMALRGPAGVIHDIFIDPERRREGLGRLLLDATIAALKTLGAPQIVLSTAYKNDTGQKLFTSAGLRPTMIEMTLTV